MASEERAPEPVGRTFLRRIVKDDLETAVDDKKDTKAAEDENTVKLYRCEIQELNKMNYYQMFGVDKFGVGVDNDLLKRQYHKCLLIYHPDKAGAESGASEEEDEVFLTIQNAYAILSDPGKRRAYDSTNEFDDTIPTGREAADQGSKFNFYTTYGPVFVSNARFSNNPKVPAFGDDDTPFDDVYAFYDWWAKFDSWRDFSLEATEHDPEAAESREEKRYMQKENEKIAKGKKVKEYARIVSLVDRARANDPRLKRAREAEAEAKKQAREARQAEARRKDDEIKAVELAAAAAKEEEEARRREEAKEAKIIRDKEKKALRKAKKLFLSIYEAAKEKSDGSAPPCTNDEIDWMLDRIEIAPLEELIAALGGSEDGADASALPSVHSQFLYVQQVESSSAEVAAQQKAEREETMRQQAAAAEAQRACVWTEAECSMLAKAAGKFPAGTRNRWQSMANFINQQCPGEKPKTEEECIKKFQERVAVPTKPPDAAKLGTGTGAASAPAPTAVKPAAPKPAATTAPAAPAEDVWSEAQQKQLESGLATHPASMETNERWKAITQGVSGKSKKQCVERYKLLRNAVKAGKV